MFFEMQVFNRSEINMHFGILLKYLPAAGRPAEASEIIFIIF